MLYFATTNKNKIQEAKRILDSKVLEVELSIEEIQTLDPEECASKKAITAYQALRKPVLVEDTALFFEALNGLPGVFIDHFMKALGLDGLLRLISQEKNRRAYAQTTLAISRDGKKAQTYAGRIYGSIPKRSRGEEGFGWDPIFIPEGTNQTFAQMTPEVKDKYSMRRLAFEKLKRSLGYKV